MSTDKFIDWILELLVFGDNMKEPYIDERLPHIDERLNGTTWIRTFDVSFTDSEEYIWHRDTEDRTVIVLEGEGWKFQFDDQIPQVINRSDIIFIPKMVYHRLIKGTTDLKIKIKEG